MRAKKPSIDSPLAAPAYRIGFLQPRDWRLLGLTLLNALLYWPWRWLRVAYDSGDHHPSLVLAMVVLTLWLWFQLLTSVIGRLKDLPEH
jgi:hypothetical protein